MIVFDLSCAGGHRFEGWFGSSQDFADQQESGLVSCPHCGSPTIAKAPMAPAVPRKGAQALVAHAPAPAGGQAASGADRAALYARLPPVVATALARIVQAQREALRHSRWVGSDFAETSRAMHYGEREEEVVHGRATAEEARSLLEDGIAIAPLLFPATPPDELN